MRGSKQGNVRVVAGTVEPDRHFAAVELGEANDLADMVEHRFRRAHDEFTGPDGRALLLADIDANRERFAFTNELESFLLFSRELGLLDRVAVLLGQF